ncbi:hypothetical protein N0V86_002589 [Didymella sp. IMI 355093]|nr:hypothetical protein N0V86_002589 [Didymella sp. IMI 355093]
MASKQETCEVARPKKRVTFGLIVLALFMPWFALYLDGSSWPTIGCNFAAWLLVPIFGTAGAIIHAIVCLCRSDEHRKYSKPARRRLRYNNDYSANDQVHTEKKAVKPESEPAPVTRAITEPPPAPATRAVDEESALVVRSPTEPLAKNPLAAPSSTSVSSSDIENEDVPAPAPAPAPPPRTATASPSRAPTAKKDEDPFKDPDV